MYVPCKGPRDKGKRQIRNLAFLARFLPTTDYLVRYKGAVPTMMRDVVIYDGNSNPERST